MSRNTRETKMHYNNSTGRDGVFIVEVSRGIDCQHLPESPITDREKSFMNSIIIKQQHQQRLIMQENNDNEAAVQIHQPPRDDEAQQKLQQIVEVIEEVEHNLVNKNNNNNNNINTGLSQSDLSSSSSGSCTNSNKCYNYGNQTLYTDDINCNGSYNNNNNNNNNKNKEHKLEIQEGKNEDNEISHAVEVKSLAEKVIVSIEEKLENNNNNNIDKNLANGSDIIAETSIDVNAENGYDSLMSLPEPPSFDEIKQLNDGCNTATDSNQLDSLTLPPPPPPAFYINELQINEEQEDNKNQEKEVEKEIVKVMANKQQSNDIIEALNINYERDIVDTNANNKEILSTQLTPPESPPPPSNNDYNCSNGIRTNGICAPLPIVSAVNVNGS